MVKLITPMGMLITVALLALYAAYAFWTAYVDKSWIYGFLGVLSLVACYGTAMLRAWSQYLVYLLTALFVAAWCYSVYAGAAVGFFSFFYSSQLLAARSSGARICTRRALVHRQLERVQSLSPSAAGGLGANSQDIVPG